MVEEINKCTEKCARCTGLWAWLWWFKFFNDYSGYENKDTYYIAGWV